MYNKNRFQKINDKKIIHKVRKNWVTVSVALLGLLGTGAFASHTHVSANSTNNNANSVTVKNNANDNSRNSLIKPNQNSQNNINNNSSNESQPNNQTNDNENKTQQNNQNIMNQASNLHNNILMKNMKNTNQPQKSVLASPTPVITSNTPSSNLSGIELGNDYSKVLRYFNTMSDEANQPGIPSAYKSKIEKNLSTERDTLNNVNRVEAIRTTPNASRIISISMNNGIGAMKNEDKIENAMKHGENPANINPYVPTPIDNNDNNPSNPNNTPVTPNNKPNNPSNNGGNNNSNNNGKNVVPNQPNNPVKPNPNKPSNGGNNKPSAPNNNGNKPKPNTPSNNGKKNNIDINKNRSKIESDIGHLSNDINSINNILNKQSVQDSQQETSDIIKNQNIIKSLYNNTKSDLNNPNKQEVNDADSNVNRVNTYMNNINQDVSNADKAEDNKKSINTIRNGISTDINELNTDEQTADNDLKESNVRDNSQATADIMQGESKIESLRDRTENDLKSLNNDVNNDNILRGKADSAVSTATNTIGQINNDVTDANNAENNKNAKNQAIVNGINADINKLNSDKNTMNNDLNDEIVKNNSNIESSITSNKNTINSSINNATSYLQPLNIADNNKKNEVDSSVNDANTVVKNTNYTIMADNIEMFELGILINELEHNKAEVNLNTKEENTMHKYLNENNIPGGTPFGCKIDTSLLPKKSENIGNNENVQVNSGIVSITIGNKIYSIIPLTSLGNDINSLGKAVSAEEVNQLTEGIKDNVEDTVNKISSNVIETYSSKYASAVEDGTEALGDILSAEQSYKNFIHTGNPKLDIEINAMKDTYPLIKQMANHVVDYFLKRLDSKNGFNPYFDITNDVGLGFALESLATMTKTYGSFVSSMSASVFGKIISDANLSNLSPSDMAKAKALSPSRMKDVLLVESIKSN